MSCPTEPIPTGWRVWRNTEVPTPLVQLAVDVRDHIGKYPYGSIARTVNYQGQTVGVFVSHHTWTWRNGQLVTGICIPGASIIIKQPGGIGATEQDNLDTPDPTAAVYGADDVQQQGINWPLVAVSGGAAVTVAALFLLALKLAGRARGKR